MLWIVALLFWLAPPSMFYAWKFLNPEQFNYVGDPNSTHRASLGLSWIPFFGFVIMISAIAYLFKR